MAGWQLIAVVLAGVLVTLFVLLALVGGSDPRLSLGASQQNVSKHLGVLADAGILGRRKNGNRVYYRIVDDGVITLCEDVCGSLQQQLQSLSDLVGLGRS